MTSEAPGDTSKRQKIVHLTQKEHVRQRPEVLYGSMAERPTVVPVVDDEGRIRPRTVTASPGVVNLTKEGFDNCLDNCQRDETQTYIAATWDGDTLTLANDGSTLPVERDAEGRWPVALAFGEFQAGSNFDTADTGRKDVLFTAGLNGVGSKGLVVFGRKFVALVQNMRDAREARHVWETNMDVVREPVVKPVRRELKRNLTRIEWTPDFAALGVRDPSGCMEAICEWAAYSASLCAPPTVRVTYNGVRLKLRTPVEFCKAFGGTGVMCRLHLTNAADRRVCDVCVAVDEADDCAWWRAEATSALSLTHAFVNATPCREGTHAKHLLQKIAEVIEAKARSRREAKGVAVHVTPTFIARRAVVVGTFLIEDPRFTAQDKRCLDTKVAQFGWPFRLPDSFCRELERSALVDLAIREAREREDAEASRVTRATPARAAHIAKYERPRRLHTPRATLIVTEGDSAKNFGVAGLSVGRLRDDHGIYPIRGKFLNVRGLSPKAIADNKEANELLRILGLQMGVVYTEETARKLPYARLMILSDQDVDGGHIAGLLCNLVHVVAPSLLRLRPDYVVRFATALIRVTPPRAREDVGFYSQGEFDAYRAAEEAAGRALGTVKFFKGLGTCDAALAKRYFADIGRHTTVIRRVDERCDERIDLFFHRGRAADRKAFLLQCDPEAHVDYSADATSYRDLVERELLPQFARASIRRAIPSLADGFKESLRKVFYGARHLRLTSEISVAKAAGKISSLTNYHHRGTAMEDAIIGMAARYAGTANLNLLEPRGQFGSRHSHVAASAAYPNIVLNAPLHRLLYPPEDDAVLTHVVDEGERVEPEHYVSVIPTALCFGCRGIAVGWSTEVPQFDPRDLVAASLAHLAGDPLPELTPWYRGFGGPIEREAEGGVWTVRGVLHREGRDVHVTEVPPFRETDAHKEEWTRRFDKGVEVGDGHTDERVHLILRDGGDATLEDLGLVKRITFGNVHLLDARGELVKYESPERVVREHAALRLALYDRRLAHLVAKAERELLLARSKARYVRLRIAGEFVMAAQPSDAEACAALDRLGGLHRDADGSYDYLLDLPDRTFNAARAEAIEVAAERKAALLAELRAKTPEGEWRAELLELRAALDGELC